MKNIISRVIGIILLVGAIIFVMYAFNHPTGSFTISPILVLALYILYVPIMIILLKAPVKKK